MKRLGLVFGPVAALALPCASAFAEEGGSLPQLDPSFYPGELFWLAVCFPLFYLLMQFVVVPMALHTQENRRQILDGDLSAARKASDHAKAMLAEGEKALAVARAEVRSSVDALVAEANKKAAEQRSTQEAEIAVRLAEANRKIEAARAEVMKDVPKMVDDLVASIVTKVLAPQK